MMVRIREPLTSQQLETMTERWLVIDPVPPAMLAVGLLPSCSARVGWGLAESKAPALAEPVCPLKQVAVPKAKAPPVPGPAREQGNR